MRSGVSGELTNSHINVGGNLRNQVSAELVRGSVGGHLRARDRPCSHNAAPSSPNIYH